MEETRALAFEQAEIRASGSGDRQRFTFHGYAATFGTRSHELREPGVNRGRPFREIVKPGAATETIRSDDIRFVLNHRMEQLLGRTSSGTLRLGQDSRGLEVEAELPNTSYANDYAELVQRGDAGEMSFRFFEPVESWPEANVRALEAFRLREVSALTVPPAYPGTSAELEAARMLAWAEEELRAGRVLSQANLDALEDLIARIRAIIEQAEGAAEDSPADKADPNDKLDAGRSLVILRRRLDLAERGLYRVA